MTGLFTYKKADMAKITLGQRPKNFKKTVSFQMLDGTTGTIEVSYKYRTRTEFGQFIDSLVESAKTKGKQAEAADFSMADLMEKTAGQNAEYILDVVDSWDLDAALSAASAQQLADEIPAAAIQIMEDYRLAITEGRLGN